jgi:hypothetical protein
MRRYGKPLTGLTTRSLTNTLDFSENNCLAAIATTVKDGSRGPTFRSLLPKTKAMPYLISNTTPSSVASPPLSAVAGGYGCPNLVDLTVNPGKICSDVASLHASATKSEAVTHRWSLVSGASAPPKYHNPLSSPAWYQYCQRA